MLRVLFLLCDFLAITLSFILAKFLRYHGGTHFILNQMTTLLFLVISILLITFLHDLYNHNYYAQSGRVFFKLVNVWIISFITYILVGFLTKFYFLMNSRGFIFYYFFIVYPLIISFFRLFLIPRLLISYFSKPEHKMVCRYIGPKREFIQFSEFFKKNPITGIALVNSSPDERRLNDAEVFIYSEEKDFGELYKEIQQYATFGKKIHIASRLFNDLPLKWDWCKIEQLPIISLKINSEKNGNQSSAGFLI